jgi:hypothetical protein
LGTTIKLRRGGAGFGLGTKTNYLRRAASAAVFNGLGTTIKYQRGAAGIGLSTTINYPAAHSEATALAPRSVPARRCGRTSAELSFSCDMSDSPAGPPEAHVGVLRRSCRRRNNCLNMRLCRHEAKSNDSNSLIMPVLLTLLHWESSEFFASC